MPKKKGQSVTSVPCRCTYLEAAADEPENPIVFDRDVGRYEFEYRTRREGTCRLVILHCPWCGGVAPKSKMPTLFAPIARAEAERLQRLASRFRTLDEAIAKLGKPDEDMPDGQGSLSAWSATEPMTRTTYRVLRYKRLSKTVDVELVDFGPAHGVKMTLQGKYIGPKRRRRRKKARR